MTAERSSGSATQTRRRASKSQRYAALREALGRRSIVLIGLMGAGKSAIGRRLATKLGLPFTDADAEIEAAAGKTISDIFAEHGEPYFRDGERRVIARLLRNGPQVLATGGGAYMHPQTREAVRQHGISVWLKADVDVLLQRIGRRDNRPLLMAGDRRSILEELVRVRHPVYAQADITVFSRDVPHEVIVGEIIAALSNYPLLAPPETAETAGKR